MHAVRVRWHWQGFVGQREGGTCMALNVVDLLTVSVDGEGHRRRDRGAVILVTEVQVGNLVGCVSAPRLYRNGPILVTAAIKEVLLVVDQVLEPHPPLVIQSDRREAVILLGVLVVVLHAFEWVRGGHFLRTQKQRGNQGTRYFHFHTTYSNLFENNYRPDK